MSKKKSSKQVALIAATVLLGLMTGCTGLQETAQEVVSSTTKGIENVASEATNNLKESAKKDGRFKELTAEEEAGKAVTLHMDHSVGNIEVKNVSGTKITVKSTIWASKSVFNNNKDMQKVFDQAEVSIAIEGDTVRILTHAQDHPEKDLWQWSEQANGYSNFSIDYEIGLPSNVTLFDISNDVGEVKFANVTGEYRIQNDVGSIEISGAHFTGDSTIKSSTGGIVLDVEGIDGEGSLQAVADIGSVEVKLDEALSCILDIETDIGSVTGASKGESIRGDGGPRVSLSTSVGSINVE